ncbi:MAG: TonB-dependent receptor [Marinilabiliaceae bacterium]|nr:TonB-dependent receptor [Marinilabiliaceae bacterium]
MTKRFWRAGILACLISCVGMAQAQVSSLSVIEMSEAQIRQLSYNDLLQLSLEDLMTVANRFGMSADEILEYFLNKDVVAASKKAEKSMESPLSTTVISKEQIEQSGVTNIPEALRMAPGVIVREKTPGNYDVHIRGFDNIPSNNMLLYSENMLTLLMIDNRPVYNYSFGGTLWETLPIEVSDVERIEIIRGASSALYGPNAVTGTINIITKKATDKKLVVHADNAVGNNNSKLANVSGSFGVGEKLKLRLSGNYQWNGRFNRDHYYYGDGQYHPQSFFDEQYEEMTPLYKVKLEEDIYEKEPLNERAGEKFGANISGSMPFSEKVNVDFALGSQKSVVLSSALGNQWNPLITRDSETHYADLRAQAYGFQFQANYLFGERDYERMSKGFYIMEDILNLNLEYEYKFKNLTLRPGVSYQETFYDDSKKVDAAKHEGYLNGKKELSSLAYFLRADYTLFQKLRLIGAIRGDKYNKPDKNYFTWQFVGSYKINDNHMLRAVYSRANRGPFMADTYSNYKWETIPGYYNINWNGKQDLKLPVMDMIEFGYRVKPIKNIQAEFEVFRNTATDYSWFIPDSLKMYNVTVYPTSPVPTPVPGGLEGWISYHNFDLKVIQTGASANVQVAVSRNLTMNVFGTWQKTELENFYPKSTFEILNALTSDAGTKAVMGAMIAGNGLPVGEVKATNEVKTTELVSQDHEATPSFYGGAGVNYILKDKWNINTTLYYYGKQTFVMNRSYSAFGTDEISAKTLVNLKVSYEFMKDNKVFVNVRNLLDDRSNEFAFADQIGAKFFAGVNLTF